MNVAFTNLEYISCNEDMYTLCQAQSKQTTTTPPKKKRREQERENTKYNSHSMGQSDWYAL